MQSPLERKAIAYLDQNKWVQLLVQDQDTLPGSGSNYDELKKLKETGRVLFPLTAMHYLETWHRANWESRWALACMMYDLSDFCTMAPMHKMQRVEVERAVYRRLKPSKLRPIPYVGLIGYGVDHAFASQYGRFRYVESVETEGHPEGPPVDPGAGRIDDIRHTSEWGYQWFSLAFLPTSEDIPGLDRITQHRRGGRYAKNEEYRSIKLRTAMSKVILSRALITEDFIDLLDDINRICEILNVDPHNLVKEREDIPDFVRDVPTRNVFHVLRSSRYRNPQGKWDQHDLADFLALAVAIPYCDVVVTEKHWKHVATQAGLDKKYDTQIFHRLDDAVLALQGLVHQ